MATTETVPVHDLSATHGEDTFNINDLLMAGAEHDVVTDTCSLKFARDVFMPMLIGASGAFELDAVEAPPTFEIVAGKTMPELVIKGVALNADFSKLPAETLNHPLVKGFTAITGGTPFKGKLKLAEVRLTNELGSDHLAWTGQPKIYALNATDGKANPMLNLALTKGLPALINPQRQLENGLFKPIVAEYDNMFGTGDGSHAKEFVDAGIQLVPGLTADAGKFKIRLKTKTVTPPAPAVTTPLPVGPTG